MDRQTALKALKKHFGYDRFRPNQWEVIESIYNGKDSLVIMPTGGGKSICYQIPAITLPGTCLVVSPLISLMKDQVEALKANGISAAFINSSQSTGEQRQIEDDLFYGRLQLVYVSPEKLTSRQFLPLLKRIKINLFAVDEAHCISSWGHDFRPEYTQLKFLRNQFPDTPIAALTATADKVTRDDIVTQMGMNAPERFIASFDRPNLSLKVRPGQQRLDQILQFLRQKPGQSGIIYCLSRKQTEDVSAGLNARGIRADYYHAGMDSFNRSKVQEAFLKDEITVVCATVAFGMGIDKSNVRFVIHYNLPQNIESYYQEIGRAGRDGINAETLLFYSFRDVVVLRDILSDRDSEQTEIKLAKLERMQQYAESLICRRKMLLSYFGEHYEGNCGNCDICLSPPTYFDGTVLAQKALSALLRLKEKVGMNMLIDVLRGSGRKEILSRGFDKIKTYGAGRHHSAGAWKFYLTQMVNMGLMEIAYTEHNTLKATPASQKVLFENEKVELVQFESARKHRKKQEEASRKKSAKQLLTEELFERLRALRREMAQKKGVPPYIIFSDATLQEMASERPTTDNAMREISGVGEQKMRSFARPFLKAIRKFEKEKSAEGVRFTGATYLETLRLLEEGRDVEEIAEIKGIHQSTVFSHIAYLYENDEPVRIQNYVSEETVQEIASLIPKMEKPLKLKPIFEELNETVPYELIRLALARLRKEGLLEKD
jgi:ATP-dependent DNA helicase RecQ